MKALRRRSLAVVQVERVATERVGGVEDGRQVRLPSGHALQVVPPRLVRVVRFRFGHMKG